MKNLSNKVRMMSVFLAFIVLLSSCGSATLIQSSPNGADVYIDGILMGRTPYTHYDMKISGSATSVELEHEGYETLYTYFSRNEEVDAGAIVAGLFFWIPFLWTMKYKPTHYYEMVPLNIQERPNINKLSKSKADQLRELKQLLDEKIISVEEFEKEKAKILNSN